jgi:L-alanine-DL-glutamate epimerase-like enolase superfamily enzyme
MWMIELLSIHTHPFRWDLGQRTANATRSWQSREAALVGVSARGGNSKSVVGWSEAAPLPGFSPETLKEACAELRSIALPMSIDDDVDGLESILSRATRGLHCGSARFAFETAIIDLIGKIREEPAKKILRTERAELPIAALLRETSPGAIANEAQHAHARGIRTVKMKISGRDTKTLSSALSCLRALRRDIPDLTIRLDANGSLMTGQLVEGLALYEPEVLEEPVSGGEAWSMMTPSPIPLAIDESLLLLDTTAIEALAKKKIVSSLVLKPMLLGLTRTWELARLAEELGLFVIVTHLFDGPVAAAATAEIALSLRGDLRACGLDSFGRAIDWPSSCTPPQILTARLRPQTASFGWGVDPIAMEIEGK